MHHRSVPSYICAVLATAHHDDSRTWVGGKPAQNANNVVVRVLAGSACVVVVQTKPGHAVVDEKPLLMYTRYVNGRTDGGPRHRIACFHCSQNGVWTAVRRCRFGRCHSHKDGPALFTQGPDALTVQTWARNGLMHRGGGKPAKLTNSPVYGTIQEWWDMGYQTHVQHGWNPDRVPVTRAVRINAFLAQRPDY